MILYVLGDLMYGAIMTRHITASSTSLTKRCDEMLPIVLTRHSFQRRLAASLIGPCKHFA
jgi:hypothetical protein